MLQPTKLAPLLLLAASGVHAFTAPAGRNAATSVMPSKRGAPTCGSSRLHMALDPVTYLRTEWVSAALCTNQTPRSADKVLQLGCEDGRAVNFVPRTVREIITSSAEPNGEGLTVTCERQLKQQAERRKSAAITYSNQAADDLVDTPSSSIDIVISLQAAQRMHENGLDWKRSIREAGRVLKPGGRFLFVESADVGGESYLDEVTGLSDLSIEVKGGEEQLAMASGEDGDPEEEEGEEEGEEEDEEKTPLFEEVGYDQVDMVLQPHIAGVAIKALGADMTPAERAQAAAQEESDRMAEMSLNAFERGSKKKRRKKKKAAVGEEN